MWPARNAVRRARSSSTIPPCPDLSVRGGVSSSTAHPKVRTTVLVPRIIGPGVILFTRGGQWGSLAGAQIAVGRRLGIVLAATASAARGVVGSWMYHQLTRPLAEATTVEVAESNGRLVHSSRRTIQRFVVSEARPRHRRGACFVPRSR